MRSFIRSHLTYANVTATLALFVALGGVGYAAATLPKNSVGTAQIKKDAVTGAKVKNSSLTGSDIKNKSLTASDFKGSVQGPQGPQGIQGPKGDPGPAGTPDGYTKTQADARFFPNSRLLTASADPTSTTRQLLFDLPDLGLRVLTDDSPWDNASLCFTSSAARGFWIEGRYIGGVGDASDLDQGRDFCLSSGPSYPRASQAWVWQADTPDPYTAPLTPVLKLDCASTVALAVDHPTMTCTATRL